MISLLLLKVKENKMTEVKSTSPEITSVRIDKVMFVIIDKDDVKRYCKMERNEMELSLVVLEKGIAILKALGHEHIKLISYYCLAEHGFLLAAADGSCGIKIPH